MYMLKSLTQFFSKKPKPIEYIEETIYVKEKQKFNVKKSFATVRLKNGENVVSKVFYGAVNIGNSGTSHYVTTGRQVFNEWIYRINFGSSQEAFLEIKEDRYVRISDIMDIINVVESEHEIEAEVPVAKILRREA